MRTRHVLLTICLLATLAPLALGARIIPVKPESEPGFDDFTVELGGEAAPVWGCRVSAIPFNRVWPGYQRSLDQTEVAGFVTWETDEASTEVVVRTSRGAEALKSVVVRPLSLGISPAVDAEMGEIRFSIPGTKPVVLEVGGFHGALHLLPFPIYQRPEPGKEGVRYFGPGVHKVGSIEVKSGEEIFVDAGAVVYGGIKGVGDYRRKPVRAGGDRGDLSVFGLQEYRDRRDRSAGHGRVVLHAVSVGRYRNTEHEAGGSLAVQRGRDRRLQLRAGFGGEEFFADVRRRVGG